MLTISLRLASRDDPAYPLLHVTCQSRHWWDQQWSSVGCYPDLEILRFLWRDARAVHPDNHTAWEPYGEPSIFAYRCPRPLDVPAAQAQLAAMQAAARTCHAPAQDKLAVEAQSPWCDLFHPDVYQLKCGAKDAVRKRYHALNK